jgi:hypothetical protein
LLKNSAARILAKTNLHQSWLAQNAQEKTSSNSALMDGIWVPKGFPDEATAFLRIPLKVTGHSGGT